MITLPRLLSICMLCCVPLMSFSQSNSSLERLFGDFESSCVCMGFTYDIEADAAKIVGKGDLQVQGNAYHMTGNGLEVFCNGTTSWVIDDSALEVIIEEAGSSDEAGPALILARLDKVFNVTSARDGKVFSMTPKVDCGVLSAEVTFGEDGRLRSGRFNLDGGETLNIRITYIRKEQKKDISFFCPDIEFDSEWVVTDLR